MRIRFHNFEPKSPSDLDPNEKRRVDDRLQKAKSFLEEEMERSRERDRRDIEHRRHLIEGITDGAMRRALGLKSLP